jgi:hypothetical protein
MLSRTRIPFYGPFVYSAPKSLLERPMSKRLQKKLAKAHECAVKAVLEYFETSPTKTRRDPNRK